MISRKSIQLFLFFVFGVLSAVAAIVVFLFRLLFRNGRAIGVWALLALSGAALFAEVGLLVAHGFSMDFNDLAMLGRPGMVSVTILLCSLVQPAAAVVAAAGSLRRPPLLLFSVSLLALSALFALNGWLPVVPFAAARA